MHEKKIFESVNRIDANVTNPRPGFRPKNVEAETNDSGSKIRAVSQLDNAIDKGQTKRVDPITDELKRFDRKCPRGRSAVAWSRTAPSVGGSIGDQSGWALWGSAGFNGGTELQEFFIIVLISVIMQTYRYIYIYIQGV